MKNPEKFDPEETAKEAVESLKDTPAGEYMEGEPAPDTESLKEEAPRTNEELEKELGGEMVRVHWENRLNDNSGSTEPMPREKAEKWMEMRKKEYPDEQFYRHWLEPEKEDAGHKK